MPAEKAIKVLVSMIGLDGHTTGGELVASILRNAGIEVVYLGIYQTPEMIVEAAIQEDVDAIGISSHAANYDQILQLLELLKASKADHIAVFCGGNIPRQTTAHLKRRGIAEVFHPRSTSQSIVSSIVAKVKQARAA